MKNSVRARRVAVEIDGGMFSRAWIDCVVKVLFGIATARVENGQPEIIRALRGHCLFVETARRRRRRL